MNPASNEKHRAAFNAAAQVQKDSSLNEKTPRKEYALPAESQVQPIHRDGPTEKHFAPKGPTIKYNSDTTA